MPDVGRESREPSKYSSDNLSTARACGFESASGFLFTFSNRLLDTTNGLLPPFSEARLNFSMSLGSWRRRRAIAADDANRDDMTVLVEVVEVKVVSVGKKPLGGGGVNSRMRKMTRVEAVGPNRDFVCDDWVDRCSVLDRSIAASILNCHEMDSRI